MMGGVHFGGWGGVCVCSHFLAPSIQNAPHTKKHRLLGGFYYLEIKVEIKLLHPLYFITILLLCNIIVITIFPIESFFGYNERLILEFLLECYISKKLIL